MNPKVRTRLQELICKNILRNLQIGLVKDIEIILYLSRLFIM